jgi:hypothetical protein
MDAIRHKIVELLDADNPMTVRQVFYRLVVAGVIEKTEEEYPRAPTSISLGIMILPAC